MVTCVVAVLEQVTLTDVDEPVTRYTEVIVGDTELHWKGYGPVGVVQV